MPSCAQDGAGPALLSDNDDDDEDADFFGEEESDENLEATHEAKKKKKAAATKPAKAGRSASAQTRAVAFHKSKRFTGSRPGFVFMKGDRGVGYYTDTHAPSRPDGSEDEDVADDGAMDDDDLSDIDDDLDNEDQEDADSGDDGDFVKSILALRALEEAEDGGGPASDAEEDEELSEAEDDSEDEDGEDSEEDEEDEEEGDSDDGEEEGDSDGEDEEEDEEADKDELNAEGVVLTTKAAYISRSEAFGANVITESGILAAPAAYVPPARRNLGGGDDGKLERTRRHVKGLLNRLNEANLIAIIKDLEGVFQRNSRNETAEASTPSPICRRSISPSLSLALYVCVCVPLVG